MEIYEINSDSERTTTDALEEPLLGATRADLTNESNGRTNTSDPCGTNGMHQVTYMEPLLNNDELSPADSKAAMASYMLQQAAPIPSMRYEFEADTTSEFLSRLVFYLFSIDSSFYWEKSHIGNPFRWSLYNARASDTICFSRISKVMHFMQC